MSEHISFEPIAGRVFKLLALMCLCAAANEGGRLRAIDSAPYDIAGPALDHPSGLYDLPFELSCVVPLASEVYFTTNGASPSPATGLAWKGALKISRSISVRVAAFRQHQQVGPVLTQTYLFPEQVAEQTGAGFPDAWGATNGQPVTAAYALDSDIVNDQKYRRLLAPALRALPSISVVMDPEDLFGPGKGIYSHPQDSGPAWERASAMELINPEGKAGFAVDCGIRIQGGWNRRPEESPKHAFRLVFNRRHGAEHLKFPLFGTNGVCEFETLILRAGCNNTWLHWSGEERHRGDYMRDQWMRDTLRDMGHPSARGLFVHLYLNGLYWGIYNLVERPSASFAAANLGGLPKEYDCRNGNHILDGTDAAWKALMENLALDLSHSTDYAKVESLVDIPEFIDYMIANLYGANADWDSSSNWYAVRRRKPAGKFEFLVWDGERTLEAVEANTLNDGDEGSPPGLFQHLRQNESFRRAFADRVQMHFFGAGALTADRAAERYRFWADKLDLPIVAESARWGGYRAKVHPYKAGPYELYTRDEHWRPEIERLLHAYFPQRGEVVVRQFVAAKLFSPSRAE